MAERVYSTAQGNKTISQMRAEIVNASGGMPEWQAAPDANIVAKYGELTGRTPQPIVSADSPLTTDNTVYQLADGSYKTVGQMRADVVNASGGMPMWQSASSDAILSKYGELSNTNPQYFTVALPYQINPIVWDSLSSTAQNVILGAAEAGQTPSGVWTSDDYTRQIDATRPQGSAPKRTNFDWSSTRGSYF